MGKCGIQSGVEVKPSTLEGAEGAALLKKVRRHIRARSYEDFAKDACVSEKELDTVLLDGPEKITPAVWEKVCTALGLTMDGFVKTEEPRQ